MWSEGNSTYQEMFVQDEQLMNHKPLVEFATQSNNMTLVVL